MGSEAHFNTTQCPQSWAVRLTSNTSINTTSWAVRHTSIQHSVHNHGQRGSPQYNTVSTIMGSGAHLNTRQGPPSWAGGGAHLDQYNIMGSEAHLNTTLWAVGLTSIQHGVHHHGQWSSPKCNTGPTIMGRGAHLNTTSWAVGHLNPEEFAVAVGLTLREESVHYYGQWGTPQ